MTAVAEPAAVLPLIVIRGESAGPLFIVVAGVHGDEYEGPQAIWQVAQELPPASLRGTLLRPDSDPRRMPSMAQIWPENFLVPPGGHPRSVSPGRCSSSYSG